MQHLRTVGTFGTYEATFIKFRDIVYLLCFHCLSSVLYSMFRYEDIRHYVSK